MIHQQRTPLQRFFSNIKIALLVVCLLAVQVSAKPLTSGKNPDTLQLSSNNALAPKSTENKREIESAAAPAPLSPEHERARELWNRAKKLQHQLKPRRYVRNVPRYEREVGDNGTNRNVSKYILELYKNLTESTDGARQQGTQANTVRSLQTINDDTSTCGIFNFSLSSINSSEYIVKAELRFSLTVLDSTLSNVVATIVSKNASDSSSVILRSDIVVENNNQRKYVFDVAGKLYPWIRDGAKYAEFQVNFFADLAATTPLGCEKIHFYHRSDNEDTEPLLVVHSIDSELDKIDYKKILDTVRLNKTATGERRRRAVAGASNIPQNTVEIPEIPFCDVISLNITNEEIPRKEIDEDIFMPAKYDAGICGGDCGNTMPQEKNLGHNVLIHMLQGSLEFRNRHGYQITRCCAPIKYAPLEVIVFPPTERSAYIRIIPNMKIVQCECLEIVDFSNLQQK